MSDWPAITTEEVSWHLRVEDAYLIPKSRRRKMLLNLVRKIRFYEFQRPNCAGYPQYFSEYRRKIDTKTVRRNVALPSWLNYEAEHAGINVSRVLQEALMNVLNVKRNI